MNLDLILALFFGALCGLAVGIWRTWSYARKLIHFGISLDAWSEYCEATEQARGRSGAQRSNVTAMHRGEKA